MRFCPVPSIFDTDLVANLTKGFYLRIGKYLIFSKEDFEKIRMII